MAYDNIKSVNVRYIVFYKYGGNCAYCGIKLNRNNFNVDHIIPKRRGFNNEELKRYGLTRGGDNLENYNPSCRSCNSSKSNFTIEKWRKELTKKHDRLLRDNSSYRVLNRFGVISVNNKIEFYFEKYKPEIFI